MAESEPARKKVRIAAPTKWGWRAEEEAKEERQQRQDRHALEQKDAVEGPNGSTKELTKEARSRLAHFERANEAELKSEAANSAQAARAAFRVANGESPGAPVVWRQDHCACGGTFVVVENDSLLSCKRCGISRPMEVDPDLSSGAPPSTASSDSKTKLAEKIAEATGTETGHPSFEALKSVFASLNTGMEAHREAIKAERDARGPFLSYDDAVHRLRHLPVDVAAALKSITGPSVRAALMASGDPEVKKAVKHSAKAAALLSGLHPLRFTLQDETKIKRMFSVSAPVYESLKETESSAFLCGYQAWIRGACLLLGLDEFLELFPDPVQGKAHETRERIRKRVCDVLQWEFVEDA